MIREAVSGLARDLGFIGAASIGLIALTAGFWVACIKPLEERLERLDRRLVEVVRSPAGDDLKRVHADPRQASLEAFYRHFHRKERVEDWLAAVYGIATASGLELNSAEYRLIDARHRLERYQIRLPVSGSYSQVRSFLETTLAEIPVVSLDHASFRRKTVSDARIEADVILTLHLPPR